MKKTHRHIWEIIHECTHNVTGKRLVLKETHSLPVKKEYDFMDDECDARSVNIGYLYSDSKLISVENISSDPLIRKIPIEKINNNWSDLELIDITDTLCRNCIKKKVDAEEKQLMHIILEQKYGRYANE
jgi:hypothetical protein